MSLTMYYVGEPMRNASEPKNTSFDVAGEIIPNNIGCFGDGYVDLASPSVFVN